MCSRLKPSPSEMANCGWYLCVCVCVCVREREREIVCVILSFRNGKLCVCWKHRKPNGSGRSEEVAIESCLYTILTDNNSSCKHIIMNTHQLFHHVLGVPRFHPSYAIFSSSSLFTTHIYLATCMYLQTLTMLHSGSSYCGHDFIISVVTLSS